MHAIAHNSEEGSYIEPLHGFSVMWDTLPHQMNCFSVSVLRYLTGSSLWCDLKQVTLHFGFLLLLPCFSVPKAGFATDSLFVLQ